MHHPVPSPCSNLGKRNQPYMVHFRKHQQSPCLKKQNSLNYNYFSPRFSKQSLNLKKELITPEFIEGNTKSMFKFPINQLSQVSSVNKSVVGGTIFFPGQHKKSDKYQSNINSFDFDSSKKEFVPQFIRKYVDYFKNITPPKKSMFTSILKSLESGQKFTNFLYFTKLNDNSYNVRSLCQSLKKNHLYKPETFSRIDNPSISNP
jgi:hypothetical protein